MRTSRRAAIWSLAVGGSLAGGAAAGCGLIVGIHDVTPPDAGTGGTGATSSTSTASSASSTSTTSSSSGTTCGTSEVMCGSSCVDLQISSANCGVCGHLCNGGESCAGGLCQPEVIVDGTHGLNGVLYIAAIGSSLYGTNSGAILSNGLVWTSSKTGAGFTYLTPSASTLGCSNDVGGMAVDATYVWFGVNATPLPGMWRAPITGMASSTTNVVGYYAPRHFAIDVYAGGPYMYTNDGFGPGIGREPKSGTPSPPTCVCFGSGFPPLTDLLTDASGNVYWTMIGVANVVAQADKNTVAGWSCDNNCAFTTLASAPAAGLGLDATSVYYSDTSDNKIKRVPIGGGPVTDLTTGCTLPTTMGDSPHHLVVDDARIYWSYGSGNVWAIKKDGTTKSTGTIAPIVTGQPGAIWEVTFDADFLYFGLSGTGQVRRVSK